MKLLTVKETCERLRISRATLYNLVKKGELVFVKVGGKSLISEEVIDNLIAKARRIPPKRPGSGREAAWAAYWDELVRRGIVDPASRAAFFAPKLSDFKPIKARGKPASEIIIEERGAR